MRLKELRIERALTQLEVATGIQTRQSNIGRWENHEVFPSSEFVVKLADFFNVSTDYLLGRTDDLGAILNPSAPQLPSDELDLLNCYRKLLPAYKDSVLDMVRSLSGSTPGGTATSKKTS